MEKSTGTALASVMLGTALLLPPKNKVRGVTGLLSAKHPGLTGSGIRMMKNDL